MSCSVSTIPWAGHCRERSDLIPCTAIISLPPPAFEALVMPKTGPCSPNWCLYDPLAMTWMPVKFRHSLEWISACRGLLAHQVSLLRCWRQWWVSSNQSFLPCASVPSVPAACSDVGQSGRQGKPCTSPLQPHQQGHKPQGPAGTQHMLTEPMLLNFLF